MAELTTLEEKLAEVLGLAQAAKGATEKVEGMVIVATLKQIVVLAIAAVPLLLATNGGGG